MVKQLYQEYFGGELKDTQNPKNNMVLNRKQYELLTGLKNDNILLVLEDTGSENLNKSEDKNYFLKTAKQNGFIDAQNNLLFDKSCRIRRLINYPKLSGPRGAVIELTNICYLSCITCYNEFNRAESNEVLSTQKIKSIIDELYSFGAEFVFLSGGETTCRNDWLDIAKYVHERDMSIRLYTCGVYPEKKRKQTLADIVELSPKEIRITYAGMQMNDNVRVRKGKKKETFNDITRTVKSLIDEEQNVKLNYILSHENVSETENFLDFVCKLNPENPPRVNIGPVRAYGSASKIKDFRFSAPTAEDFYNTNTIVNSFRKNNGMDITVTFDCLERLDKQLIKQKRNKILNTPWPLLHQGCDFGRSTFSISYDGTVNVCGIMGTDILGSIIKIVETDRAKYEPFKITPEALKSNEFSNVKTKSIEEIWYNSPVFSFVQYFYRKEDCEPCDKYRVQCMGMCQAMSLYDSGDLRRGDRGCVKELL